MLAVADVALPAVRSANKAEAAEFFDVAITTIDSWLRRGCPYVQRGGRGVGWVFDLLAMAKWRYAPEEEQLEEDPEQMRPKERLEWYRGNRERDAHAKDQDQLIPFELEERIIGAAFAEVRASLLSQHNTIAGERPELSSDVIQGILSANKNILARLAETQLPQSVAAALDRLTVESPPAT